MSDQIYTASVYERTVKYTNFKGETMDATLTFALDPLQLLSVIAGALYIGPRTKRIAELFEAEGPTSLAARALLDRVFLVSRLELVSFAIIIALMVFKPGTGPA